MYRLTFCLAAWFAAMANLTASPSPAFAVPAKHQVGGFSVGLQAWTFRVFTLQEAIAMTAQSGARLIELYPAQRLSAEHPTVIFNHESDEETVSRVLCWMSESGIRPVNYGVLRFGADEGAWRRVFSFARRMGIQGVTVEPPEAELQQTLDLLERLVQEYDIRVGIHNHPPRPDRPEYRLWDPGYVTTLVEGRDVRMGVCADIGHWVRSGIRPVDGLQRVGDRLISMHINDLHEFDRRGHDVAFGLGVCDIPAVLAHLRRTGFGGHLSIEFGYNSEHNLPEVAQSVGFIRGWAAAPPPSP
jgi:sugar phosphate isomerase/epimerase